MLENCSDSCGWAAALLGALSLGSFGAPIKYALKKQLHVDPLVLQTYKSIMCFLTCWLVLLIGEEYKFTYWGIVSGLFWVPGATAGIYAIQNAGLAISYGVWSSLIVITSFCWGIFVFHERVKSVSSACFGAAILIVGLIGMARYSAPTKEGGKLKEMIPLDSISDDVSEPLLNGKGEEEEVELGIVTNKEETISYGSSKRRSKSSGSFKIPPLSSFSSAGRSPLRNEVTSEEEIPFMVVVNSYDGYSSENNPIRKEEKEFDLFLFVERLHLSRRQLGIIGAIVNGVWGGTNMIPMHFARSEGIYGAGYLISYAIGSMIVTVAMWLVLYLINLKRLKCSYIEAFKALPSFYLRELLLPGVLSGCLYSLGNFCAIIAISTLGQGVGYSCVQTALLVSGVWGIFVFGEVQGIDNIFKWLLSSAVTIIGIIWLGLEHQKK